MKNKFIRTLVIINGVLIPLFILTLFGLFLREIIVSNFNSGSYDYEKYRPDYVIEYTSPKEIVNSDNYFVARYQVEEINILMGHEQEATLANVPDNTVNIIFLDKEFNKIGTLLEKDASIKHMYIPNQMATNPEEQQLTQHLIYQIALEDSDDDQYLDRFDQHYLYISDLEGKNLTKVLDKKVKDYTFFNEPTSLLITYYESDDDLAIGVYDIDKKTFEKKTSLSFDN